MLCEFADKLDFVEQFCLLFRTKGGEPFCIRGPDAKIKKLGGPVKSLGLK